MAVLRLVVALLAVLASLFAACGGGGDSSVGPDSTSQEPEAAAEAPPAPEPSPAPVTAAFLEEQIELEGHGPLRLTCPREPPKKKGQSIECDAKLFVAGPDYVAVPKFGTATITQTDVAGGTFRYRVEVAGRRFGGVILSSAAGLRIARSR
jgi:hypothetical protein